MIKKIIKAFRPLIILSFRTLWFITRPTTQGAKVVILCGDEVLLIRTTYGYGYSLPGGGMNRGETPKETALREVREEVGINLREVHALPSFITYEEYKQDTVHSFYAFAETKDFTLDRFEIDEAAWFPLHDLPFTLGPVSRKSIDLYIAHH